MANTRSLRGARYGPGSEGVPPPLPPLKCGFGWPLACEPAAGVEEKEVLMGDVISTPGRVGIVLLYDGA